MRSRVASCLLLLLCGHAVCAQEGAPHEPSWSKAVTDKNPPAKRIRVGADWQPCGFCPQPAYPKQARDKKLRGSVRLRAVVAPDGSIRRLETISGAPLLAQAAIDSVKAWKYKPTLLNGKPVEVETVIDVIFRIDGSKATDSKDFSTAKNPS